MNVYLILITVAAMSSGIVIVARKRHEQKKKKLRACVVCYSVGVEREHEKVKCPGGAVGEYWCRTNAHCKSCNARYIEKDWYHYTFSRLRMFLYPSEFQPPSVKDIAHVVGLPKFVAREVSR